MRLLIVTSHFFPENFKCNDMAFDLAERGHDVTVLAPIPDYPQGHYYEGYGIFKKRRETIAGVKVIRTFVTPRRDGSSKWLALNYLTHTFFSSCRAVLMGLANKYDAIIVHETSPVLIAVPAVIVKKMQKIPLYFWILDLWPESLSAAGGIKDKNVLNFFGKLTKWLYDNSDKLLIGSKGYRHSISSMGEFDDKIEFFPNWVENTLAKPSSGISVPDFPEGFNIVVAGNMGDAQDLPHVLEAAKQLDGSKINFIFIGDGRKKEWAESYVRQNNMNNTYFFGRFPLEAMPGIFAKADILFMALKDTRVFALTVPSRLQAYMASGKPVVAMINGEGADVIKDADCGWSVPSGDSAALAELLLSLSSESVEILEAKGNNGKKYSRLHYDFSKCMDHLDSILSGKKKRKM